jgi:hypothetical protein
MASSIHVKMMISDLRKDSEAYKQKPSESKARPCSLPPKSSKMVDRMIKLLNI